MQTHSEAVRLNLEYYHKQAKALLKAAQAAEPDALERIARQSAKFDPARPRLHDAQLAVAREQGFPSWPRFRTYIVQSGLDWRGLVSAFIAAAVSDRRRAEEMLAAHPEIADAGFYAALVLGDAKRVERAVAATPALATSRSGPQNLEPLVYVCFSRFASGGSSRAGAMAETARILLRHGADPNTEVIPDDLPDNPLSCLYSATGLNNNPALALALLEAGANPNDPESLYHATEHADLACVRLLLAHGASKQRTNALRHILDREDEKGARLLLAAGANPNEVNDAVKQRCTGRCGEGAARLSLSLSSIAERTSTRKEMTAGRRTPWPFKPARQKSPHCWRRAAPGRRCPHWTALWARARPAMPLRRRRSRRAANASSPISR